MLISTHFVPILWYSDQLKLYKTTILNGNKLLHFRASKNKEKIKKIMLHACGTLVILWESLIWIFPRGPLRYIGVHQGGGPDTIA